MVGLARRCHKESCRDQFGHLARFIWRLQTRERTLKVEVVYPLRNIQSGDLSRRPAVALFALLALPRGVKDLACAKSDPSEFSLFLIFVQISSKKKNCSDEYSRAVIRSIELSLKNSTM